jgi:hypothetical protein
MRCLVSTPPAQSTQTLTGGPKARLSVNTGQLIGEDSKWRRNDPRVDHSAQCCVVSGTVATIASAFATPTAQ